MEYIPILGDFVDGPFVFGISSRKLIVLSSRSNTPDQPHDDAEYQTQMIKEYKSGPS